MRAVMSRSTLVAVFVLIAVGIFVTSANPQRSAKGLPSGPIIIGMPVSLTGPIALYDGDMVTGARTAARDINRHGGVLGHQIKIVTADTHSDIAQSANAALAVIGEGAQFVIPTLDYNFGGGAARVATSKRIVAISGAGDLRFGLSIGRYVFNLYVGDPTAGAVMAQFARKNLKWSGAYLLVDQSTANEAGTCNALGTVFEKLGGKVVGTDQFQQTDQSIATQITRLREVSSQISGVVICSHPPGGASALRQIRSAGITAPVILSLSFDSNTWESGITDLGKAYVLSVGLITIGKTTDPGTPGIYARAAALAHKPPTFAQGLLQGYSAVQAIVKAVQKTRSTNGARIAAYLETFRATPLAMGATTWTKKCHARAGNPLDMTTVVNNKLQFVAHVTPTVLPTPSC